MNSIGWVSALKSGVSSLTTKIENISSNCTTISGNAASIAYISNYYSGLQSSIAVTNGNHTPKTIQPKLKLGKFSPNTWGFAIWQIPPYVTMVSSLSCVVVKQLSHLIRNRVLNVIGNTKLSSNTKCMSNLNINDFLL
jgi:hypothetical protein